MAKAQKKIDPTIGKITVAAATEMPDETLDQPRRPKFDRSAYLGIAGEISGDPIYVGHTRWPNGEKHFPIEPLLHTCSKFFPYAKGGALYIDEPEIEDDVTNCKRKAEAMKKEGLRYCYIPPTPQVVGGEYADPREEAMAQLEGSCDVA